MGIKFTRRGYIEVWRGEERLSQHTQEREAIESLSSRGPGEYRITYPEVAVRVIGTLAVGGDTEAPSIPTGVIATALNKNEISVSWDASTDNVGVTGYHVFANGVPQPDVVSGVSTTLTGLTPSTFYSITVAAFDAAGNNSGESSPATETTPANALPVWGSIAQQNVITNEAYTLDLADSVTDADVEDTHTYSVLSGTLPSGLALVGSIVSGTPTTAGQNPTVTFRVNDGNDTADKAVVFASWSADVTAPPVPTGLAANPVSSSQINLSWNASTDASGGANQYVSGTQDYRVYRDGSLRTTTTQTSYNDTGLSASTQYSYRVSARDVELNESAQSAAVLETTSATATTAEDDWAVRSTASGVTYAQDFRDPGVVNSFFVNPGDEEALAFITRDTTDGVTGGACLRIITPSSYGDTNSAVFRHPLSSAWTANSQHFGTTPFYMYWRMKINAGRLVPSTPGDGWKFFNLAQYDHTSPAASISNTPAEIVGQDVLHRGFPQAYYQNGEGFVIFDSFGPGGNINFQNQVDNGAGLANNERYCLYNTDFAGCIKWPVDQWFEMKARVKFGTYNGSIGNEWDMWIGLPETTTWLLLQSFRDFELGSPQSGFAGSNGLHWHIYETNRTSSTKDAVVKYDQIIISTEDVVRGIVPAQGTLYDSFAALAEDQFGTLSTPSMTPSVINNGSNDSIISWARRGHADLGDNKLYFYGCTHGGSTSDQNMNYMIRYDIATHTWTKETINDPEPFAANGIHGYYHFALRQSDGRQYLRQRGSANIFDRARGGAWGASGVPDMPGSLFDPWNVADALEWYPDFGAYGALVFSCENAIYTWEPGDTSWTQRYFASNGGGNDTWIVYNKADSRIYTGIDTTMRRLDPDGTVVARAGPPFNCSVGTGTPGTVFSSGLVGNRMFAVNASGSRPIHEYNHSANTWGSSIATLPFDSLEDGPSYMFFGITVPGHGVIFHYIDGNPNPSSTMHLWKH